MTKNTQYKSFVFVCPVHGIEANVFCFRAYDPEHLDRWFEGRVDFKRRATQKEVIEFLKSER